MINKKTLIIISLSMLIFTVSLVLFLNIFFKTYKNIQSTAELVVERNRTSQTVDNIAILNRALLSTKKQRQFLNSLFLDIDEISNVLQELESLAASENLKLSVVTVTESDYDGFEVKKKKKHSKNKKKDAFFKRVSVSLSLDGKFQDLVSFIDILENMPRVILVDKLHISVSKKTNSIWSAQARVVFLSVNTK